MTRQEVLNNYWRFYLLMEDKFLKSLSYVELHPDNYKTFSIEFVSQLREVGSEIDVIMKEICGFAQSEKKTIADYAPIVLSEYPKIADQIICGKTIELKPFDEWCLQNPGSSLQWWDAYNKVKHGRVDNFLLANLENAFNALGALYILNNFLL